MCLLAGPELQATPQARPLDPFMDPLIDPLIDPIDPRRVGNRGRLRTFLRRVINPKPRPPKEADIFTAARHITGAIGAGTSPAYEALAKGGESLNRSLQENPLPPSTHISHRDATRHNLPVPLSERCIEDYRQPEDS